MINTDGFRVFNSSRREPWGIFATINELPFKERIKPSNIIILGIYHGDSKPDFNKILKPVIVEIKRLSSMKVQIENDRFSFKIFQNSCDKPARSAILSLSGHRSQYPCVKCLVEQNFVRVRGTAHYFVPTDSASELLRDDVSFKADAILTRMNGPSFGIKKYPVLLSLQEFKPVSGSIIDQLHCIGGVGKKLLQLIIKEHPNIVDDTRVIIKCLKPPKNLVERIRDLSDIANFKGHEFRSFFLYYGPIVLMSLIPTLHVLDNII